MATNSQILEHYTNLFCKIKGFKARDLENHPFADDLVMLVILRDEYSEYFTQQQWYDWKCIWVWVYAKKFPLKNKHRKQLEEITIQADKAKTRHQNKLAKIRQLRQTV